MSLPLASSPIKLTVRVEVGFRVEKPGAAPLTNGEIRPREIAKRIVDGTRGGAVVHFPAQVPSAALPFAIVLT